MHSGVMFANTTLRVIHNNCRGWYEKATLTYGLAPIFNEAGIMVMMMISKNEDISISYSEIHLLCINNIGLGLLETT